MLIAIISDTHDNLANLERFFIWARNHEVEIIVHCGDIASASTVEYLAKNFSGEINLVYGNMDAKYRDAIYEASDERENIKLRGDLGELKIETSRGAVSVGFCHLPETAKELAEGGKYDLVFYGHTHKPWIEKIGRTDLVNPGTLAGLFNKATFAVYDTDSGKLELKLLSDC